MRRVMMMIPGLLMVLALWETPANAGIYRIGSVCISVNIIHYNMDPSTPHLHIVESITGTLTRATSLCPDGFSRSILFRVGAPITFSPITGQVSAGTLQYTTALERNGAAVLYPGGTSVKFKNGKTVSTDKNSIPLPGPDDASLQRLTAAALGDGKAVNAAIGHAANLSTRDADGNTALHLVVLSQDPSTIIKILTSHGADPNCTNNDGWTPLHIAAAVSGAIEPLLMARSNPNVCDKAGNTPFMILCQQPSRGELLEIFHDYGANFYAKNNAGETAMDISAVTEDREIQTGIQNHISGIIEPLLNPIGSIVSGAWLPRILVLTLIVCFVIAGYRTVRRRRMSRSPASMPPKSQNASNSPPIAVADQTVKASDKPDIKKCPYCAEEIKAEAIICRFCGRDQQTTENSSAAKVKVRKPRFRILLSLSALICLIGGILGLYDEFKQLLLPYMQGQSLVGPILQTIILQMLSDAMFLYCGINALTQTKAFGKWAELTPYMKLVASIGVIGGLVKILIFIGMAITGMGLLTGLMMLLAPGIGIMMLLGGIILLLILIGFGLIGMLLRRRGA